MKSLLPLLLAMTLPGISAHAQTQEPPIKVACVGDSITEGGRGPQSYPAQLGHKLGAGYEVRNFGNSGSTMLRDGDKPYEKQREYQAMLDYRADIYVVKLGTNDTKPHNWAKKENFKPSAYALIDAIRGANPKAQVFVCLPIPAFPSNFGITNEVILEGVIPQLKEVAAEKKTDVIDLYSVLNGHGDLVPDRVHPNAEGYRLISEAVEKEIRAYAQR